MKKKITHSVLFVICRQGELIIYDLQFRISGGDRSPVSDRNVWWNVPYE